MIVDGDVDELPSWRGAVLALVALADSIAGNAMADGIEASEFFDIDVDDLAGLFALLTWS